jgi:acyl carrier protein phosphodiesterase
MGRAMLTQQQLRKLFPPLNGFLNYADDTVDMSTSLLPTPPLRANSEATVEDLISRIADLVLLRQSLRSMHSDHLSLEQNRCELVAAHWDLSRALIARHCPPSADAEAAAA